MKFSQIGYAITTFDNMGLKMPVGVHKMQRTASALNFFERYHKHGDEFLNHVVQITGNETWVPFMDVKIKE
jgi:hypothetical protein